jgi:Fanconi anemia group M protein
MKKSIRPFGQKTLFQTWNKQTKNSDKQKSTSLFETWGATNTSTKVPQNAKRDNEKSLEALINIDDEDDNELLAAIDEIEKCANAGDNHDIGNLSFSASSNDGCEAIEGFDCSAGNSWIYPTNYPLREYQFAIVQKALFHNTLVTLPTGLGKTFIAAVVMYNFYRWYPQGKIIFMAPTKPLVAQQIDACYNIMGIPNQDTAEMTG